MPNVLMVCPEYPVTFWSFDEALKMVGKRSAFPPLGLLTIAGMMPDEYTLRLVDMNVGKLDDEDLGWADVVLTSSMIIQWPSLEQVIDRCNRVGVPVLNGGPLPTQYSEDLKGDAIFYMGEAENGFLDIVERMIADPGSVRREFVDRRGEFKDLEGTPLPRWDLLDFDLYQHMVVQMTRGCPEKCTFCNIPFLYGKQTRIKASSRMIQELDALHDAGWRGTVMAVDDNLIGNRDAIREALVDEVIPWQKERDYPFRFFTQASVRLSEEPDLLEAMHQAGFDEVFVGIESPAEESLKFMGARKNLQGSSSLMEKVRTIQRYGFEVMAGFIIGLDTDPDDIADQMIDFIQEAGIPVAMVGILCVLRDTPDYKRYGRAGRLIEQKKAYTNTGVFSRELNYVPAVDPEVLYDRHRKVVETINSPVMYFQRCLTHLAHRERRPLGNIPIGLAEVRATLTSLWRQGIAGSYRRDYWRFLARALWREPADLADALTLAVQGHHLITTTQQALRVAEMKTFLDEALERVERFCGGYREAFQQKVEAYASRLMGAVDHRFAHFQDDRRTLQHNVEVLLSTALDSYGTLRDEFRNQVREQLETFQIEITGLLVAYAGEEYALQRIRIDDGPR